MHPCEREGGSCPEARLKPGQVGFCPCWYVGDSQGQVLTEKNRQTGETRVVQGCYYEVTPRLLQFTVMEQGSTAAEVSAMRTYAAEVAAAKVQQTILDTFQAMLEGRQPRSLAPPAQPEPAVLDYLS